MKCQMLFSGKNKKNLFGIKYVNLYQQPVSCNLIG